MSIKFINVLSDKRLYPTVMNIIKGSNKVDTAIYTFENYVVGEHDLSTYDWYVDLMGVDGLDEVKLEAEVIDGKLQITFPLTSYVTRIGNTLTYQLVAKDSVGSVWNSAKGIILNSESIQAEDVIVADYPSILKQWEERIAGIQTTIESVYIIMDYDKPLPPSARTNGKLYLQRLNDVDYSCVIEDSDGHIIFNPEEYVRVETFENKCGFRRSGVAYLQGDKAACPYHPDLMLVCTVAGTTSDEDLDTSGELVVNDILTDGTVEWKIDAVGSGASSNSGGLPLFAPIWSDHLYNDASYLRADTFSWHNSRIYVGAYKHLVDDIDGITAETETIGSTTITFYRCADHHKVVLADQEANVEAIYNETGIAWYFILDVDNGRFKLPRTKWGFVGARDSVGGYVKAGLPTLTTDSTGNHTHTRGDMNITGKFGIEVYGQDAGWNNAVTDSGAFYRVDGIGDNGTGSATGKGGVGFDASRSWTGATSSNGAHSHTIAGTADTVQQRATEMYLYFYVGYYPRAEAEVNVGLLTELVNGSDLEEILGEIETAKNQALADVNSYQQPLESLTETSGTIALEVNKIYSMEIGADTTFNLPVDVNTSYFNQIKVMAKIVGTPVITWGTTYFVNKTEPELEEGVYDIYFDYDNHLAGWVVGVVSKGVV